MDGMNIFFARKFKIAANFILFLKFFASLLLNLVLYLVSNFFFNQKHECLSLIDFTTYI